MIKASLDWKDKKVVQLFGEVSLWSAPFGRMLLEYIPMKAKAKVLDLGFGTGFPLIELSQRFGADSLIYGMDVWEEAIQEVEQKIELLEINNIQIFKQSAAQIPLASNHLDLICSNLGINNFEEKEKVYQECFRCLAPNGKLCLTTNPIGTFSELFALFGNILAEKNWENKAWQDYVNHRGTETSIIQEIESFGFKLSKKRVDVTKMRFVDTLAVFNHSLMRIAFVDTWRQLIGKAHWESFFESLKQKITKIIETQGAFNLSIPMLYLEFEKNNVGNELL